MIRNQPYKIFYRQLDEQGNIIGEGVYHKEYKLWGNAFNVAKKRYGDSSKFDYEIATRYPWMEYTQDVYCGCCGKAHTVSQTTEGWDETATLHILDHSDRGVYHSYRYQNLCPECLTRVLAYIESLKEVK